MKTLFVQSYIWAKGVVMWSQSGLRYATLR